MENTIIAILKATLGAEKVLTGDAVKERYHHIWHMDKTLNAKACLLPNSTAEVASIMQICYEHHQAVIVFGGLTNLVGATETKGDEVIISMEKMNQIEEIDPKSRSMTVQAGVILENIQTQAKEHELLFPLNFGAKGSAQIGGIVSTNAGGLRVLRFGMTRQLILGLEAVLADGTIVSSMKKIIKDNSAYDLKQLFVGSEGTLGIITRVVLKLIEAPKSRNSAFVAFNDYDKVVSFLKYMDAGLAGTLSGFELIWGHTYQTLTSPPASVSAPIPYGFNYYVLLESLGSQQEKDFERLQELLEIAFTDELILEAALAQSASDLKWFWTVREDVHVIASQCNHDQHFDISLPIPKIGTVISDISTQLKSIAKVTQVHIFGHVADGNIHLVVGKEEQTDELIHQINKIVYGPLQALGGSVSAEHGIGLHKKKYLPLCRTKAEINLMKTIKKAFDPKGILNPGKVIDV